MRTLLIAGIIAVLVLSGFYLLNNKNNQLRSRGDVAMSEADINKAKGEKFLAENKKKESIVTLENGLQYKIIVEGQGAKPNINDVVEVHYAGTLIDGTEFDSSYKRGEPGTFPLKAVIAGWTEALQLMPVGSTWELYIPPQLAYGSRGAPPVIGPNETLIFKVELLGIK